MHLFSKNFANPLDSVNDYFTLLNNKNKVINGLVIFKLLKNIQNKFNFIQS
ncbi:MAG: hypothetical protein ucyna2_00985 [Candidatus Atelocyanobacterium thalassa isolate SIO64986]|uniref:Uncharacterized protein n=1 Tax=Candidatus Atelocyanobacterium thalassa isolate SIO64986 TaxID=1527444 RepID=A0A086CG49_9CHRO|nr:MAG: hypothetical protein ucyna2_00985 [Candidatus Atelocyanobacterium thalassa isolate SIO64986]